VTGRSPHASANVIRAGRTSTRSGRSAAGTAASRDAHDPAIDRSAVACPCPEASGASSATCSYMPEPVRNARPGGISSGMSRGRSPASP
jgi:hypothetical protein